MQTSVRNAPVVDECVGSASVRRSVQESLRRSDSSNSRSSTCGRSATASLTSRLCSAEERISVPAGTVNPRNNTCLFPGTTVSEAGPTNVVHQRDVETDVRRLSTAGPTRGGGEPSRNRRASTFGGVSISNGTENRRGGLVVVLRVVITFVNRMRRWMSRHSARRCQGLPLPHAVADVRRFLDALYYEEICFLVLRSCLTVMHTGILLYSCILEEPFQVHVPVAPLLAVLAGLTLLRVICQFQIVRALSRLRWAWWQREVLADFVKLLRSPLWQCQRLLFVVSFSFYFVALHIAYYRGPTSELEVSRAPVLMRYVSLVVLTFLSVLGPHILMLVIVCTSLIVCWCASTAEIEQILVEEPRGAGRALPSRLLQMIHEEQWMPPGRNCSRSSNMYNGVSSSSNSRSSSRSKCSSDNNNNTTHVSNKQLQEYQKEEGRRNKSSSTRTCENCIDEDERNASRNSSCCDSRPQETRKPDGNDRERVTSDSTCAICLTEFYEGDVVRRLPCSHVFHSACITRWLSSHASCPLRCYVNFFSVYMSQPPYNANRHLRVLGFQLLRRPRCRLLESFRRQRHERHVVRGQHGGRQQVDLQRQQQEQPQEQQEEQQQELQQQGGDDCQQNQDQQWCAMNEEEEKQEGVVQRSDQIRQARSPLGTGAGDRVAEIRLPVDQVHDRNDACAAAGVAPTELQAYIISPRLQCLSSATVRRMPSHGPEDIMEVEDLAAQVQSEGVANTVLLPCSTIEANKEDHDTCFVPVKVSDHHLQEKSGRLDANEDGLTVFLQKQNSDVYYTAGAALAGHAVSASLESTVALSTSSGDGSSGCLASQCDQGKYSPEEDD